MVVSILFTYTNHSPQEKRAEVLLSRHSLENVNGPNTLKFPATTTVCVGFVCSVCYEMPSNTYCSHYILISCSRTFTFFLALTSEPCHVGSYRQSYNT